MVNPSLAEVPLKIAGSSTVYPFITVVAEEFGRNTVYKTPIVEANGTGGGFKLFCHGMKKSSPDIVNASRRIKKSEEELCKKNSVDSILEIKIGYDGIVLASSVKSDKKNLTKKQIFLAVAKKIPLNGKLVDNYYLSWNEISPLLPDSKIRIYGPPPSSGTRDSFVKLLVQDICVNMKEFKELYLEEEKRKAVCSLLREDGVFIDVGENDNLIVQKIINDKTALGIFGYSFLEQNSFLIQGSVLDGVIPDFNTILDGSYTASRPLYIYVNKSRIKKNKALKAFLKELTSYDAMGNLGYLSSKGLVPVKKEDLIKIQNIVEELKV